MGTLFILNRAITNSQRYQQGIDTKNATFETIAPDWIDWDKKFLPHPRLVAITDNTVIGWAALSAVSSRRVYAGVCEVSVYIHPDYRGQDSGRQLLNALINASERNNIWTLQARIFLENIASIKFIKTLDLEKLGFG